MAAVRTRRALDTKGADDVMTAAEEAARRNGHRVVIAVVDAFGHLLQLRRTKGDFDPTSAQARAAWKVSMPADAAVVGHA